jgi:site-specific recombinase XerD
VNSTTGSGLVHVRSGADGKERAEPLNTSGRRAIPLYLQTREDYSAQDALFSSQRGAEAMSLRAMQATIQQPARRAKINRIPVSAHTCRHSVALS